MKKRNFVRLDVENLIERINPDVSGGFVNDGSFVGFSFQIDGGQTKDHHNLVNLSNVSPLLGQIRGVAILANDGQGDLYQEFVSNESILEIQAFRQALGLNATFLGFRVNTGDGDDTVASNGMIDWSLIANTGGGDDEVQGGAQADVINLGSGADIADGGGGNDVISGGSGNDTLVGGGGKDAMDAGADDDDVVADTADFLGADGKPVDNGIFPVVGGSQRGGNNDRKTDNLTIISAPGHVLTYTNDGFEVINGGAGDERLRGGAGNQNINGGGGNDTLDGGAGNDTLAGGDGVDLLSFAGSAEGVTVILGEFNRATIVTGGDATGDSIGATASFEGVEGSNFDDNLFGRNGTGGFNGDDDLRGLGGNDNINGQRGNDRLDGGDGDDLINGGSGNDDLRGGNGNDLLEGSQGNDVMAGGAGSDQLDGGVGSDTILIDATPVGNNTPRFATENDSYFGSADGDRYQVNGAADKLRIGNADFVFLNQERVNSTIAQLNAMVAGIGFPAPTSDYDAARDTLLFTLTFE